MECDDHCDWAAWYVERLGQYLGPGENNNGAWDFLLSLVSK